MDEYIIARELDRPEITFPMKRNEFYKEQIEVFRKTGKPTKAVDIVDVFLFSEAKELFVQKRARTKKHNKGLFDKSIGGHVTYGERIDHIVMIETIQELQVPSIILKTGNSFVRIFKIFKSYLSSAALVMPIDNKLIHIKNNYDGEEVVIAKFIHLFAGVYAGSTKTVDREASGILEYSLEELEEEMKIMPNMYTHDLRVLYKMYKENFVRFLGLIDHARIDKNTTNPEIHL